MQVKGSKKLLHYVAVNARTKETMGSVPINMTKLWIVSIILEVLGIFLAVTLGRNPFNVESPYRFALMAPAIIFFCFNVLKV